MDHLFLLDGRAFDSREAFERQHGVIAGFGRARVHIDELGLLLPEFADALLHVLIGDRRVVVGYFHIGVIAQLDGRLDLESPP